MMPRKPAKLLALAIGLTTIIAHLSSCKSAQRRSQEDSGLLEADSVTGFDVNDVSILFPKTGNGEFYPNLDASFAWSPLTFNNLMTFVKDHKFDGIEFGRFDVPKEYASLVRFYLANPGQNPSGDSKEKAASEIAAAIKSGTTTCTTILSDMSLRCNDTSAYPNVSNHREAITLLKNWRIVGMRMDLCSSAHNVVGDECEVEFRLIVQPFGDFAPIPPVVVNGVAQPVPPLATKAGDMGPFMFDVSAHLIYRIGKYNAKTREVINDKGQVVQSAIEIVNDLKSIKAASPESTNGKPLGVHPGLQKEVLQGLHKGDNRSVLFGRIVNFVNKYTKGGTGLTSVTSMQIAGPATFGSSVWVFFQGVVANNHWSPTPITGSNSVYSIRTKSIKGAGGKMYPPPSMQNIRPSINPIFLEQNETLTPETADLTAFFDNPGRYFDPKLEVNKQVASSVRNTDCVSCHMTATRAFENGIHSIDNATGKNQPSMYVPPVGVTAYLDPEVIPRVDYSLRNFGYFLPPPIENPNAEGLGIFNFVGPRVEKPAVMPRVVYESAELVYFINSRILKTPNPGLQCKGENPQAALEVGDDLVSAYPQSIIRRDAVKHAAVSDCLLYESFKKDGSFEKCAQLCQSGVANTQVLGNPKCDNIQKDACDNTQGCGWAFSQSKCIDVTQTQCSYYKDRSWCEVTNNCSWQSGICK